METVKSFNSPLASIQVNPIQRSNESRYQALMAAHHYLGAVPGIGEKLLYVATWQDQWAKSGHLKSNSIIMSPSALVLGRFFNRKLT
jgi:hypothetical protein